MVLDWVLANWESIVGIYAGIVTIASIIIKLTPSQKDDEIFGKIMNFISKYIALNKTK